jgi:spore maturation protein CgeB
MPMNILCVFGRYAYGEPTRGESHEYLNFIPAFESLGHQVSLFESFSREPYADFADLNCALLRRVEELAPHLVFCVLMQYEVWIETIRLIRKAGSLVVNWSTDDPWKYDQFGKLIASEFDLFVTTSPDTVARYRSDGIKSVCLSQWAANAEHLIEPKPAESCRYNLSFVGAAYGKRQAMIDGLRRAGIEVACFGYGWPAGPVDAKRVSEIIRESRISLNFSGGSQTDIRGSARQQIKARVFEVPALGGCLLTEMAPHLQTYFRIGDEILTFTGIEDLVTSVRSLLENPDRRNAIARQAFHRVKGEHTYQQRFLTLIEELRGRISLRPRQSVDWTEFEACVHRHRSNRFLCIFRWLLVTLAGALCGSRRGPRAARRAVYEVSWRFAGKKVYTAAGWPGRMFYEES